MSSKSNLACGEWLASPSVQHAPAGDAARRVQELAVDRHSWSIVLQTAKVLKLLHTVTCHDCRMPVPSLPACLRRWRSCSSSALPLQVGLAAGMRARLLCKLLTVASTFGCPAARPGFLVAS